MNNDKSSLLDCEIGDVMLVSDLVGTDIQMHRLGELGIFRGARIEVINRLGNDYIVAIFSSRIGLNNELSSCIYGKVLNRGKARKLERK